MLSGIFSSSILQHPGATQNIALCHWLHTIQCIVQVEPAAPCFLSYMELYVMFEGPKPLQRMMFSWCLPFTLGIQAVLSSEKRCPERVQL